MNIVKPFTVQPFLCRARIDIFSICRPFYRQKDGKSATDLPVDCCQHQRQAAPDHIGARIGNLKDFSVYFPFFSLGRLEDGSRCCSLAKEPTAFGMCNLEDKGNDSFS